MPSEDRSEIGPQQEPKASAPETSNATLPTGENTVSPAPLEDRARDYLGNLLRNIDTMLSYANRNGLPLPEDLRGKIDKLLNNPEVKNFPMRFSLRK
jgi:hypothetical protein